MLPFWVKRNSLIASVLFWSALPAHAISICTMTFNSADEKGVLAQVYRGANDHFHELVPADKNPNWLSRACASGLSCDILLISGHFGGLFFGQTGSQILALDDLEAHACARDCGGILNAKQVFLMGCNTLATKTPDQRTIEDYLHVLVNDGFPETAAEDVAASRYENFGSSMAARMSIAFGNSSSLYGFSSTGPLGAANAPRLRRAFANAASLGLDQSMKQAFSDTSFRVAKPTAEIAADVRALSCQLRSPIESTRAQAFLATLTSPSLPLYFDQIIAHARDSALTTTIATHPSSLTALSNFADSVAGQDTELIGTQVKIMRLQVALGKITQADFLSTLGNLIGNRVSAGLDYIALDQVCSIAREEPALNFDPGWLNQPEESSFPYILRLASCFPQLGASAVAKIKLIAKTTPDAFARREALRAVKGKWSSQEAVVLSNASNAWPVRDRIEAQASQLIQPTPNLSAWSACAATTQGLAPLEHDNGLWNCFNRYEASFGSLPSCLAAASQFQTESGIGAKWYCLQHFPSSVTLASCIQAAKNTSPVEKADDLIAWCFDTLRAAHAVNRSECLGFTEVLKIPGNQIKQNWNCVNQIQD